MDVYKDIPTSKYFKAADIKGKPPLTLTITDVVPRTMRDGKIKPGVSFAEDERELLLNNVNRDVLGQRLGANTDFWTGTKIMLTTARVSGPNGPTDGVKVVVPKSSPDDKTGEIDDEVPF